MKVYSPRIGAKVLLKVENSANSAQNYEKEVTTSVANAWEDLVFDYSAINTANSYHHIVLIFDNGTMGDGSANYTFLFDDIRLTNTIPPVYWHCLLHSTWQGVNYTMVDFGGNQTVNAADPGNAANNVKKTTKPSGAETLGWHNNWRWIYNAAGILCNSNPNEPACLFTCSWIAGSFKS
ncbi:MAG: hypothetical protein IPP93_05040 [Chitinophagaceae bacterium]|nr:hypothetical protein [Chitinophagaceae bacterium]